MNLKNLIFNRDLLFKETQKTTTFANMTDEVCSCKLYENKQFSVLQICIIKTKRQIFIYPSLVSWGD